jgi:hypothetical protein
MPCSFGVPRGLVIVNPLGFVDPLSGGRKRAVARPALRINRGAADGNAHDFTVSVLNPSNRLRLILEVAFESDTGTEYTIANLAWSVTALALNPINGRRTPLQLIYPSSGTKPAPDSYEVDTGVRAMRVKVSVPSTVTFGWPGTETGGQLWVNGIWEADESMGDDELKQLFSSCQLQVDGTQAATTYL